MALRVSKTIAWTFKGTVVALLLLAPSGHFPVAPQRGLGLFKARALSGSVEVPLEEASRAGAALPETELIRQVLRIVDQHYVQRDRLDPVRLLQAGFRGLAKEAGEDVEFIRDVEPFLRRGADRAVVALCAWKRERRVGFCGARGNEKKGRAEAASLGRHIAAGDQGVTLSAKGLPREDDPPDARSDDAASPRSLSGETTAALAHDEERTPFETPAARVGERVFFSNQSPSIGLRYVETLARPVISELMRSRRAGNDKAVHAFLNGMLDELDPHSSYLSFDEYKELRSGTRGQFGGVGLVIDEVHELPLIREIVPNSPAHMAGIKPGDVLLRVGSKIVSFLPLDSVLREIREVTMDAPTPVWLYRPSSGRIFRVYLTREEIPTRSVETKVVLGRPDILQVRVTGFSSHTADDILQAYEDAVRSTRGGLRAFVLDLRGNPGGLLDQAIQVADLFLRQGRIVSTRSRYDEQVEYATRGQKIDLPMVVLVNSSSASASEIVAGALKDHARAVIVGERSFGKGSVQSLFELGGGTALKLTIAHYFTPSGQSLQSVGVMPHVAVKLVQMRKDSLWMSGASEAEREESLNAHLENPYGAASTPGKAAPGVAAAHFSAASAAASLKGTTTDELAVWAHTSPNLGRVEGLEELNFSYPSFENLDSVTDLTVDSVARVGVGLLDRLLERNQRLLSLEHVSLSDAIRSVQRSEARVLRVVGTGNEAKPFAEATDAFFDLESAGQVNVIGSQGGAPLALAEPVRPRIGGFEKLFVRTGLGEHGVNTCCVHESYVFKLVGNAQDESRHAITGLVGMRLQDNADGNLVWVPARLSSDGKGIWTGSFDVPPLFRAYLSEAAPADEGAGVTFFFKRRLSSPPLLLGVLPLERTRPQGNERETETKRLAVHLRREQPTAGSGSMAGASGFVLQVKLPAMGLAPAQRYDLMLVPLSDGRLDLRKRIVALETSPTGDLVAEIPLSLAEKRTLLRGQAFGGVLGGILRTEQGDVLGKWPLAFVDEDGVRAADEMPADGNDQRLARDLESERPKLTK